MEENKTQLETLFQRAADLGMTTLELYKLFAIDKFSNIISSIAVFVVLVLAGLLSILFASIALAFWIGNCLGEAYYGFIIVAAFYAFITFILYLLRAKWIKNPVNNSLIRLLQKQNNGQ